MNGQTIRRARLLMSTFIRQWQKYIIQARLGLHTNKLKYSKTHEKVIKRNKNCQSIQLRFKMNIDIANRITRINQCHAAVAQAACGQ